MSHISRVYLLPVSDGIGRELLTSAIIEYYPDSLPTSDGVCRKLDELFEDLDIDPLYPYSFDMLLPKLMGPVNVLSSLMELLSQLQLCDSEFIESLPMDYQIVDVKFKLVGDLKRTLVITINVTEI